MTMQPHNQGTHIKLNYDGIRFNKNDLIPQNQETADVTGRDGYPPLKNKKQIFRYEFMRTIVVFSINLIMMGLLYAFCVASHLGNGEADKTTITATLFFMVGFYVFIYFPMRMGASEKYYQHLAKYYEIAEAKEEEARRQYQRQQQATEFQRRQENIGNIQYF